MKLCGWLEPCFKKGECWGHFEGIMCANMGEIAKDGKCVGICRKTGVETKYYRNYIEYASLKKEIVEVDLERSPGTVHLYGL